MEYQEGVPQQTLVYRIGRFFLRTDDNVMRLVRARSVGFFLVKHAWHATKGLFTRTDTIKLYGGIGDMFGLLYFVKRLKRKHPGRNRSPNYSLR